MKVAIIVPTYQKRKSLRDLMVSLRPQAYKNFKIVIVDNNVEDSAISFVADILSDFQDLSISHLKARKNLGAGGGRNFGAKSSDVDDCEVFAFIDDDCEAHENWVKLLVQHFNDHQEHQIVFGRVTSDILPKPPFIHGFDMQGGVFGSGNCAIRKEFFLKMGGFDTYLNNWAEDFEIGERCKRFNTQPIYLKDMLVNHPPKIVNYKISNFLLNLTFYKKFIYITKVRNYAYKSPFKKDLLKRALVRLVLFCPLFGLGFFHPALILSPFFFHFFFQIRKLPYFLKTIRSYPFEERLSFLGMLKYLFLSWLIDIFNGGLVLVFSSPILEKSLVEQVRKELVERGLNPDKNISFLSQV